MMIGQYVRSAGTVRPARHRQNALMELAITFEGGIFGGLVVGDIHVARKGNVHRIEGAPTRCAFGLEQGNALADHVERCELVEEQIVAALGHAANGRGAAGSHPERRGRVFAGGRVAPPPPSAPPPRPRPTPLLPHPPLPLLPPPPPPHPP